ncbi:MAG: hypothetical protein BA871_01975 [Desulfuromonadales bacterium C00003096]|nr:MAG: hypothetical protein BA871_01975 [Desulfuromonadales bacterium C00003096]
MPPLLLIFISALVIRAAAIALMMTGMSEKRARFQALSAFTGTGFTTKEAELVVNNPLRRRIISWVMILGNVGIVTVIITATSSLVTSKGYQLSINVVGLLVVIYLIYKIASHKGIIRRWGSYTEDKNHMPLRKVQRRTFFISLKAMGSCGQLLQKTRLLLVVLCQILVLSIERGKSWSPHTKCE